VLGLGIKAHGGIFSVSGYADSGLRGLGFCFSHSTSLGNFLLAPVYPLKKLLYWRVPFTQHYGSHPTTGTKTENRTGYLDPTPSALFTKPPLHPL